MLGTRPELICGRGANQILVNGILFHGGAPACLTASQYRFGDDA